MPRDSTAASMIRTRAGRAGGCGPRAATEPPGSRKAAKEPSLSLCTSSCALIRWRIEGQSPPGHSLHDHAPRRSWRGAAIKWSRYCAAACDRRARMVLMFTAPWSGLRLAFGVTILALAGWPCAAAPLERVTYLLPAPIYLPAFGPWIIARQRGYYAAEGLEINFETARGGADVAKQ